MGEQTEKRGKVELVLTHDEAVNAAQITAELRDGVLHVTLPKTEAVKPRQIAVA